MKVINIKHGSYTGTELAFELKTKLDAAVNPDIFNVEFLTPTHQIKFTTTSTTFAFLWNTTHENYLTNLHKTLGFNKVDGLNGTSSTSPNKISYISEPYIS